MPDGNEEISITVIPKISDINPEDWDACAGTSNPFVSHAFLYALEESGSVTNKTGWLPQHLLINDENGQAVACMPIYLKNHSYGEYIFDWGWAEAYNRAGGNYYPKLQAAVPFTPATGPRMLVREGASDRYYQVLMNGVIQLAQKHKASSLHITFPTKDQWDRLGVSGFIKRTSKQFHWENKDYTDFDDFLSELTSRKRKAIKKERRQVLEQGIQLKCLTGKELTEDYWDVFYQYYLDTIDRKWGHSYLTRDFFSILGKTMSDVAMLVIAEHQGKRVAGALNLIGTDTIFGRNWGCSETFKFLHFEACYYQAIEFAIEKKLKWVEAGAQGPHKIQRGYLPREVYSAHWIADPKFREAVEHFIDQERREVDYEINGLMEYSPYRKIERI
ncbi:GNAT family N-acetyltransferase [Gammaproteobacteria bacterium]|nr:GNAT family N-acetyltransferase [Gammaproteobacteria bacterium]